MNPQPFIIKYIAIPVVKQKGFKTCGWDISNNLGRIYPHGHRKECNINMGLGSIDFVNVTQ